MTAKRAILQSSWPPFEYQGQRYTLEHLDEYTFAVVDSSNVERTIIVTFSDHCFTRRPEPGDDPALAYPKSDRLPGLFCVERHDLSRAIRDHLLHATKGLVFLSESENLAVIRVVTTKGQQVYYGIFFNLDRAGKDIPVDSHLRVRTAFPFTTNQPVTHGDVRFKHLVTMRMRGRFPKRFSGGSKRWPPLT